MKQIKRIKAAIASLFGIGDLMDSILEFSDAQALVAMSGGSSVGSTGNAVYIIASENTINFGDAYVGKAAGRGTPVYLNVQVSAVCSNAAATIQVFLANSADGTTWATPLQIASMLGSACATVGVTIARLALPANMLGKYLRLGYGMSYATDTMSVDAWLSLDAPTAPLDTKTWGWTA
jgi:hypothetical protein